MITWYNESKLNDCGEPSLLLINYAVCSTSIFQRRRWSRLTMSCPGCPKPTFRRPPFRATRRLPAPVRPRRCRTYPPRQLSTPPRALSRASERCPKIVRHEEFGRTAPCSCSCANLLRGKVPVENFLAIPASNARAFQNLRVGTLDVRDPVRLPGEIRMAGDRHDLRAVG